MKNLKLRTKLLIIVLVIAVPMIALYSFMIKHQHKRAIDQELKASQEYAEAISTTYFNYLEKIWYSKLLIGLSIIENPSLKAQKLDTFLNKCLLNEQSIRNYVWVSPNGVVISSTNPASKGISITDNAYYQRIINGEDKVVSDLLIGKASQIPTIIIARGIKVDGELKGIMLATVDITKLETVLPDNSLGKTSTFGLVDRNGMIVYRSGSPNIPMEKRRIKDDSPAWKALRGEIGIINNYSSGVDGISRIGVNVPVPKIGWAAFDGRTTEEVLEKPNSEAVTSVIIMLIIFLLSFMISLYFVLDLLKPIKVLQNVANEIACSDFSVRTNLQRRDELGQTAMAFDKMTEHIQKLENSRMLFLQSAAHELRNPMTSVKGITSLIHHKVTNGRPINDMVNLIETLEKEVTRLASLLSQVLEAFKAQKQNVQIRTNMKPINFAEVIDSAVNLYQLDTSNDRTIINNITGPIIVSGDSDRLEDVIRNLISNAIKYSPEKTEINLGAQVEVDNVVVSVKDQGTGIPENQLDKIFDSFYRYNSMNERDPGGLGLGLYICKDIVMRHGGSIWAENNSDVGSTFYIKLPLYKG